MKNLAKATPREFADQTVKMVRAVERWIESVDLEGIRKRHKAPPFPSFEGMDDVQKREAYFGYKEELGAKSRKAAMELIMAMFEKHPEDTLEILALSCFVEPEEVNSHTMKEYLSEINEMLGDESVVGFFTSLGRWGILNTSK